MLTTASPAEAMTNAGQLDVRAAIGTAQAGATAGDRRNFQQPNPSIGASFHAPPTAVAQPPRLPTTTVARRPIGTGSVARACCSSWSPARPATMTPATPAPTAYRTTGRSTVRPNRPSRIGIVYAAW